MKPKTPDSFAAQHDLFRSQLSQILDLTHSLAQLYQSIDWNAIEQRFGAFYVEDVGRPGLPTRLMVGLHYLKHAFKESDESVVARWVENPYWQYLCGETHFRHSLPLDPSSLSRWRDRVGPSGIEFLVGETISTALRTEVLKESSLTCVNVDTTVQEKAVAFPTDARLYQKARIALVRAAKKRGVALRQSYKRLGKQALIQQGRYSHARQPKRARRETRRLKTWLGRVIRDIQRKCPQPDDEMKTLLERAERIFLQQRHDKHKVYSMHAPEVECIAKGKAHKKYEFGVKVSVVSTNKDGWVLGVDALANNPYDGHTLGEALDQAQRLSGVRATKAYVDKGYRGEAARSVPNVAVHLPKKGKGLAWSERRRLKRRSAIEPVIGHMKSDCRMNRNYLKGFDGDRMNAMLAGAGFNFRKLLRAFAWAFFRRFTAWLAEEKTLRSSPTFLGLYQKTIETTA